MVMTPERFYKMKYESRVKAYEDNFGIAISSINGGSTMSPHKALQIETVYSCVRDKSETVGRLPSHLYDVEDEGRIQRVMSGRLHRLFTKAPCDFMTLQSFMEFAVASYELYGAFYAYPAYNDRGGLMEIIPFFNQQNIIPSSDINGRVYYRYVTNDGKPDLTFGIGELFIMSQFTTDGITPTSPISQNAQLLEGAYETENNWNALQTDGVTSQFVLKTEKSVKADAADRLKKDWKTFRGAPGVRHIPVLEDGMTIESLKLSPKDAELLGNRNYTVNRICRIFRVPPERIGMPASASSNQTMLDIDESYMRNSIEPILTKAEASFNRLLDSLRVKKFVRFNRKAFYNGSPHKMVEAVEREVKGGLASVNEGRIDLGRDPVSGGDVFAVDNNNVTYATWDDLPSVREQIYGRGTSNEEQDA